MDMVLRIKELLYERGHTLAGSRKQLAHSRLPKAERDKVLKQIRRELQDILTLLRRSP